MSKTDYKKVYRELYKPKKKEMSLLEVPEFNYIMVDGEGNPNKSEEFQAVIDILYGLSYKIKFMCKERGQDYVVMPLEGLWWTGDMKDFTMDNKEIWKWTMMIMQPEVVTKEDVIQAIEIVSKKKGLSMDHVRFEKMNEGLSAQMLYIGPYNEEGPAVDRLHDFIEEKGYMRHKKHHEIYLSDPRRTKPENLKTIIRQPVRKKK